MTNENRQINIDIGAVDLFPAILDYDFIKNRPRGGSSRVDFFCYGRLSSALDEVKALPNIFVKKDKLFFERGIFLFDFSKIEKEADNIAEMIKNMGEERIYLENSGRYSIDALIPLLQGIDVVLMNFFERQ